MSPPFVELADRPLEVDVARLLLILYRFARIPDDAVQGLRCWPDHEVSRYFSPEYHLQKLDFLVRYPSYLAYEMVELHRLGRGAAVDRDSTMRDVRGILAAREPELRTLEFRRFLRGAHENLDAVESWWHSRKLVYTELETRGEPGSGARPTKYFFLSPEGERVAANLVGGVEYARWYADRIQLIQRYFGSFSAAELKDMQYQHPAYRDAPLGAPIPDLDIADVEQHFTHVFGVEPELNHV
jgi:hypothetical protein